MTYTNHLKRNKARDFTAPAANADSEEIVYKGRRINEIYFLIEKWAKRKREITAAL